ncbi:MAG: nucleotidyltransferase domain-containing protein [Parcubacteria group bacterium]
MSSRERTKIKAIIEALKPYGPQKVILFGSYAWGKPTASSDVDLFIIKRSKKRKIDRMLDVSRLLYLSPLPVDALVYTPEEIKRRLVMGDKFVTRIVREGKVIYEKKRSRRART